MIKVRYYNINDVDETLMEAYLQELPHFMRQEINRYKMINDRKTRLVARLMIKEYMVEKKYNVRIENWQKGTNEKPFIPNGPEFNITHSGEIVAVAFSDQQVGIDIEKMKEKETDVEGIAEYLHHQEKEYIIAAKHKQDIFFTVWAKKESYLKATGKGIAHELSRLSVLEENIIHNNQSWYFKELFIHPSYKCFICSPYSNNHIHIEKYDLKN